MECLGKQATTGVPALCVFELLDMAWLTVKHLAIDVMVARLNGSLALVGAWILIFRTLTEVRSSR